MDIFAHALWTTAAAAGARKRTCTSLRLGWIAFWGVFPDLFSFTIPAILRIWWYLTGTTHSLLPDPQSAKRLQFAWTLYHASHSIVVFAAVFALLWLVARRPAFELLGWGLHVLIDIFTHRGIFATHFLWPLSGFGVDGIPWENRWMLVGNYVALAGIYTLLWRAKVRQGEARSSTLPASISRG